MKHHLMIDLETLSLERNAVICQIGYAAFDPHGEGIISSGAFALNPEEQRKAGRDISFTTFEWWMDQNAEARKELLSRLTKDSVAHTLMDFNHSFDWSQIEGVWANGILFDLVILEDLIKQYGGTVPWHYRSPRDFKTLRALRPNLKSPKPEIAHSAEHDAIAQAVQVQMIFHSLLNDAGA